MNDIIIFTDGSSRGNPGPGGWGAIISTSEKVIERGGGEKNTTNNRMELTAALQALKEIKTNTEKNNVIIYTDSSYLIQGITKWVRGWVRNGWMTATKEPVTNQDIWEKLITVVEQVETHHPISWTYIKGHVGIPGNERVDEIATAFADGADIKLFKGNTKDYAVNISDVTPSKTKKTVTLQQKARSKAKAHSYLSLVGGELKIHTTWAECEKRVKGVKGAKFKKSLSAIEEKQIMKDWGV